MKLTFEDRRFCVYFYEQISTGHIVYVGNGNKDRPYSMYKNTRTKEVLDLKDDIRVIIAFDGLSKVEAETIEGEYLDEYLGKYRDNFRLLNKATRSHVKPIKYSEMNALFYYDETSPTFLRWKMDRLDSLGRVHRKINSVAGCFGDRRKNDKYSILNINGSNYMCHRVVYSITMKCDVDTSFVVDHIDGNTLNNCYTNLRLVTMQQNSRNRRKIAANASSSTGIRGVVSTHEDGEVKTYAAHLNFTLNGKRIRFAKYFSVVKHGKGAALRLACEARKQFEAERDRALSEVTN